MLIVMITGIMMINLGLSDLLGRDGSLPKFIYPISSPPTIVFSGVTRPIILFGGHLFKTYFFLTHPILTYLGVHQPSFLQQFLSKRTLQDSWMCFIKGG